MNSEAEQNYYFNVDRNSYTRSDGLNTTLELSAGLEPTKFRAKLFLNAFGHFDAILDSYKDKGGKKSISNRIVTSQEDQIIYSGDTIRLLH